MDPKPFNTKSINIQCMETLIKGNLRRIETNLDEAIYLFNQLQIAINKVNLPELTDQIKQYEKANEANEICVPETNYQWATELEWSVFDLVHYKSIDASISRALTELRGWKWKMQDAFNTEEDPNAK